MNLYRVITSEIQPYARDGRTEVVERATAPMLRGAALAVYEAERLVNRRTGLRTKVVAVNPADLRPLSIAALALIGA